jgi:hypothetical protein
MIERRQQTRFTLEASEPVGVAREGIGEGFERDVAAEPRVARAVDLAHATGADLRDDFEGTETRPGIHATRPEEDWPSISRQLGVKGLGSYWL